MASTSTSSTASTTSTAITTKEPELDAPVDPIAALLATVTVLDVSPFLPPGYILTPRPSTSRRPPSGLEAPRHHSARRGKALVEEGRLSVVSTTTSTTSLLPGASTSPGESSAPAWAWVVLVGGLAALAAALVLAALLAGRRGGGGGVDMASKKVRFLHTSMHQVRQGAQSPAQVQARPGERGPPAVCGGLVRRPTMRPGRLGYFPGEPRTHY